MDDHTSSKVTIRDCSIGLMRGGKGAPLLFLHGGSGAGTWLPFLSTLAGRFDVLVPEHPGFGASDTPPWLDTVADLANFYLDFLDALDLKGVHVVGHSLGGWLAADLAVRNTSRLASLTLVAAGGIHVPGVKQADVFLSSAEQRVRDLFFDQKLAAGLMPIVLRAEAEDIALKNRTTTARLTWHPRNCDPNLQKWLHRIRIPTLIIWGEHDRLIAKDHAFAYQRLIPGSQVVIIPDCGHVPQVEQEHAFTAAIDSFTRAVRIAA